MGRRAVTPPSGLEPTPARGLPIITCPNCGHCLGRLALPVPAKVAQEFLPHDDRAAELEDATPTLGHPIDRRTAPTERIDSD